MIEFAIGSRSEVALRLDRADASAWLRALGAGTLVAPALREGQVFAIELLRSQQEWLRIETARCRIAVDEDSLQYLRDRLEQFLQTGEFWPAELWHLRDTRSGRERTVYLFKAES
ncbi:hypothetical protein [Pseudomonas sp. CGJS7]|uniref:hypothetical protein n=1 Tax=Pseudomonas sp. CGJS7 TaxID=3109348 RepID=UPI003008E3EC